MKVLLINPIIREWAKPTYPPIGLGYIAAVLIQNGFEVEIYDINVKRYTDEQVFKDLKEKKFDIVGIGGQITVYREVKKYCAHLKKVKPDVPIIVGGTVADTIPEVTLNHTKADILVVGEAEFTFLELCEHIRDGKSWEDVKGILYLKDGEISTPNPRQGIEDLDSVPFPAYDLLEMETYLSNQMYEKGRFKRTVSISTTRGCAFSCTFCCKSYRQYGYRMRSVDNVIKELKLLKEKYGFDFINFADDLFVFTKDRIFEFCKKYKEAGFTQPWMCNARVNVVDDEIIKVMKDAGCLNIAFGIESGSQTILKEMGKFIKVETAIRSINLCRKNGIFTTNTFILGMPGETKETIQETVDFCKQLGIPASFFYLNPYPGTPLYMKNKDKIIEKFGDLESYILKLIDVTDFVINLTSMTDEELIEAKRKAEKDLRTYLYLRPYVLFSRVKEYYDYVGGMRPVLDMICRKIKLTVKSQSDGYT